MIVDVKVFPKRLAYRGPRVMCLSVLYMSIVIIRSMCTPSSKIKDLFL
jgi:hypothetical protein